VSITTCNSITEKD